MNKYINALGDASLNMNSTRLEGKPVVQNHGALALSQLLTELQEAKQTLVRW